MQPDTPIGDHPQPNPAPPPQRGHGIGAIFAVIGMVLFYGTLFSWTTDFIAEDKLSWRERPADLSLRYASRELAFMEASRHHALPLRAFFAVSVAIGGDPADNARQALEECEAFLRASGQLAAHPEIQIALAIMAATHGDTAAFDERLGELEQSSATQADAIRLRDAFASPPRRVGENHGTETANKISENWFHTTLMARFAASRGDAAKAAYWQEMAISEMADRNTAIHLLAFASIAISAAGLCVLLFRRNWLKPSAIQRAGWTPVASLNLVTWGGLLGIVLCAFIWLLIEALPLLEPLGHFMTVWFFLPVVALFKSLYCRPRGLALRDVFGLRPSTKLVGVGVAVLFIDAIAQTVLFAAITWVSPLPSVIEGLGEELIWGETTVRMLDTLDAALGAGIFEELVFRGVLFMGLRRYYGFTTSALISTIMFTLPHLQYGWVGLLSVSMFGFIMAWSVERTQSLLPAIIAHATCNLIISAWQWTIYT